VQFCVSRQHKNEEQRKEQNRNEDERTLRSHSSRLEFFRVSVYR
jgi:hypothetical protein